MFLRILALSILTAYLSGCASGSSRGYNASIDYQATSGTGGTGGKSARGSQKPYKINGKWYTPVESSFGFEETGLASWYGRDFHGKKTSNGEIYNMHAMTAAHKTLPMNTYVKVKRRDNGAETIVRVNDRGPFVRGRIIDLSYGAAKEIGIETEGTARVTITALGSTKGGALVKEDYSKGRFYIQVGAFTVKDNALRLKDRLTRDYGKASIFEFFHDGKTFYRVRIGPLGKLEETKRISRRVSREGIGSPIIVGE